MVAVAKDPAIKLFGKTISFPETHSSDDSDSLDNGSSLLTKLEPDEVKREDSGKTNEASSENTKDDQTQTQTPMQQSITSQEASKPTEDSHDEAEAKSLKRPDKFLPCPRCNSSDTKFCYFNNYNVNQPRHFCKSCQRYWTAGGTVRNVPLGAGRRRNKHLASQYRQIIASSDGVPSTVAEAPDPSNHHPLVSCEDSSSSCTTSTPNEMVLKFGPESPHCESTPNLLSKRLSNCDSYKKESLPCTSNYEMRAANNDVHLQQPLYHFAVPPQMAQLTSGPNGTVPLQVPGFAAPNISLQFVPASYWNCVPVLVAGPGNVSLASPLFSGDGGLQVLGKHPRDTHAPNEQTADKCISAPKVLRLHDMNEK